MRRSIPAALVLIPLLIVVAPASQAEAQNIPSGLLVNSNEVLIKAVVDYRSSLDKVKKLEGDYRAAEHNANRLKQGRQAGDLVYDDSETNRQRAWNELDAEKKNLSNHNATFNAAQINAKHAVDKGEAVLEAALAIKQDLANLEQADGDVDAAQKRYDDARTKVSAALSDYESKVKLTASADAANPKDPVKVVLVKVAENDAFERLKTAKEVRDKADKDRENSGKKRADATFILREAVTKLNQGMADLGIKTSQVRTPPNSPVVRRASHVALADGHRGSRHSSIASIPAVEQEPGSEGITPTLDVITSDVPVDAFPDGAETGISDVIVGKPVEHPTPTAPPFVEALDPPVVPTPPRPPHCVVREIPLDDPACSWKLERPKTQIELLAHPGTPELTGNTQAPLPGTIAGPKFRTRSFVFDCPAYFPIMRFKDRFQSYEDEGLRIVEGMALRIAADGSYEVEFNAEGLSTPSTIRLQLCLKIDGCPGTLTLPPLDLDPRNFSRTNDDLNDSWYVVTRGTSPFLRLAFIRTDTNVSIERDGIVRFGSGLSPAQALPR